MTTTFYVSKPSSVFIHYGITFHRNGKDFYSKLRVNNFNAGSLVHTGNLAYKIATGLWMASLNPGKYTLEVHYKSPVDINMGEDDWQTAVLQAFWTENIHAISDTSTVTNNYNSWGPLQDLKLLLHLPTAGVVLSAYQFSTEMASPSHVVTALEVNGFHQPITPFLKGNNPFLSLHGVWAEYRRASYVNFKILYWSPSAFSFTDCKEEFIETTRIYMP